MPTMISEIAPPHNLEAECALLGSILLDNECLALARKTIKVNDFYSQQHRVIFQAMISLAEKGQAIDLITVSEHLSQLKLLANAGGAARIAGLTDGVPIGTNAALPEYCRIVKNASTQRRLNEIASNVMARIASGGEDTDSLLSDLNEQVQDLRLKDEKIQGADGRIEVAAKAEPETDKKKPKKSDNIYPTIRKGAWHNAAELYRLAHENSTEGSDNWHFITFYTVVGALLGRTVGSFMGGMIYGNLFTVLLGQIGGDGKDTVADMGTNFMYQIDSHIHIPESLDSKAGFCKEWTEYIRDQEIVKNHRCILRLSEIKSYIDTAEQSGTKSITPMLNTHYAPRRSLDNASVATPAHIRDPHLCVLACGCKRHVNEIPENVLSTGLGRRFCFVPGDAKGPNPDPDPPKMEILNPLIMRVRESVEYYAQRTNCVLTFSKEAKKLWDDWYKTYWKRKRGDDLLAALNNGDRVTCRKIALINAALDKSEEHITPFHLKPAMEFIEFLYECRWPVFSEHGANPYVELENKIIGKVPDYPGRIRKRWLQQQIKTDSKTFNDRIRYMTMDDGPLCAKVESKNTVWIWKREE